ncbi:MAG: endonuclease V [Desulfurococcales archaeon]|nr:endonuclease V [Desulfurococcales archaeon]MCE4605420.1 endonuclease V [Desulfurococcales archaeon]
MECSLVKKRFSASRASRAQKILQGMVMLEDQPGEPSVIAGLDAAYTRRDGKSIGVGVAVAIDSGSLEVLSCKWYAAEVCVPYIPGLLAFREMRIMAPPLSLLMEEVNVDMVVVDGHGIAHPRGFGIASHVGVAFRIPSIGVAKKRLYGELRRIGGKTYLIDEGRPIGVYLQGVYVSPGHMVTVERAARMVEGLRVRGKLPEPTRVADIVTKRLRRRIPWLGPGDCSAEARRTGLLDYI